MMIESEAQAHRLLDDVHQSAEVREAAVHYLAQHATPATIQQLIQALGDDDFGVHWEAATSLAELGMTALPDLLRALTKAELAANPRIREGASHVLHYNAAAEIRYHAGPLMAALKGSAADITTLVEANHLLEQIELEERNALHAEPVVHYFGSH